MPVISERRLVLEESFDHLIDSNTQLYSDKYDVHFD